MHRSLLALLLALAACSACNASDAPLGGDVDAGLADLSQQQQPPDLTVAGAADLTSSPADLKTSNDGAMPNPRPYNFKLPAGYDKTQPTPLVILLHGFGSFGTQQDTYFGLSKIVDSKNFLYAYPDGTPNPSGQRFWNATDACCNFYGATVDDIAYLNFTIDDVSKKYNVDTKRIYVIGHSNGGFMSHRFACEAAPRVAAIISLAGMNWKDATKCQPAAPISVLQVHGTSDTVISYNGGKALIGFPDFPSAKDTVATWAARNGCTGGLTATGQKLDLESVLAGSETTVSAYSGCKDNTAVELWTIQSGSHIPSFNGTWATTVIDWFYAHPKK